MLYIIKQNIYQFLFNFCIKRINQQIRCIYLIFLPTHAMYLYRFSCEYTLTGASIHNGTKRSTKHFFFLRCLPGTFQLRGSNIIPCTLILLSSKDLNHIVYSLLADVEGVSSFLQRYTLGLNIACQYCNSRINILYSDGITIRNYDKFQTSEKCKT